MAPRIDPVAARMARRLEAPRSPAEAFGLFGDLLIAAPTERVAAAYLAGERLVGLIVIACGDVCTTVLPTASVLRYGIMRGADRMLLAHNHPAGDPAPSSADLNATRRFAIAAAAVGIRLVDHVIVARGGCSSLRLMGLL